MFLYGVGLEQFDPRSSCWSLGLGAGAAFVWPCSAAARRVVAHFFRVSEILLLLLAGGLLVSTSIASAIGVVPSLGDQL